MEQNKPCCKLVVLYSDRVNKPVNAVANQLLKFYNMYILYIVNYIVNYMFVRIKQYI